MKISKPCTLFAGAVIGVLASTGALLADDKPRIPALMIGVSPATLVVEGNYAPGPISPINFHMAVDKAHERLVLYESRDATPIVISNGKDSLVYNVENQTIVLMPQSRGMIRMDFVYSKLKPVSFWFSVQQARNVDQLQEFTSWFRTDHFIDHPDAHWISAVTEMNHRIFIKKRSENQQDVFEQIASDSSQFRFSTGNLDHGVPRIEILATHIDQGIPHELLAFPDLKQLADDLGTQLVIGPKVSDEMARMFSRALAIKLVINSSSESQAQVAKTLDHPPVIDWKTMRERDRLFGGRYRAALALQRNLFLGIAIES